MKKFRITKDVKHTIWHRSEATIEANTLKEAQAKMDEMIENDEYDTNKIDHAEFMEETATPISVLENLAMSECEQLIPDINEYDTTHLQAQEFVECYEI